MKTLTEKEFKKKCERDHITFTPYIWNRYINEVIWVDIEKEFGAITNLTDTECQK